MSNHIKRLKFNVIILGESQVGKSSMISSLQGEPFEDYSLSTTGIDFFNDTAEFDGVKYKFKIFDTAGQERFKSISGSTIKVADGFLVVFAANNINSFEQVKYWIHTIEEQINLENKPIIIVANKIDLEREVLHDEGLKYTKSNNLKYYETSAKTGYNIKEVFHELYSDIYNLKKNSLNTSDNNINIKVKKKNDGKSRFC